MYSFFVALTAGMSLGFIAYVLVLVHRIRVKGKGTKN
jgi:hypothetical protein